MKLRMPAIAKGFQSITFINNPAMLQRNAVAAIERIPTLLFVFSVGCLTSFTNDFGAAPEPPRFHRSAANCFRSFRTARIMSRNRISYSGKYFSSVCFYPSAYPVDLHDSEFRRASCPVTGIGFRQGGSRFLKRMLRKLLTNFVINNSQINNFFYRERLPEFQ
jgi:hypothetical protein